MADCKRVQVLRGTPLRALGLIPMVGCLGVPLWILVTATTWNLTNGYWSLGAVGVVALLPLGFVGVALLQRENRQRALRSCGEVALLCMGGRLECVSEVADDLGSAACLRVVTRLGRLSVSRRVIPWSGLISIETCLNQGGAHDVCVEEVGGHVTFLVGGSPENARKLAGTLTSWWDEATPR